VGNLTWRFPLQMETPGRLVKAYLGKAVFKIMFRKTAPEPQHKEAPSGAAAFIVFGGMGG